MKVSQGGAAMYKTKMEQLIEEKYQNCHVPVLCKNITDADSATGRKIDTEVAINMGRVKYLPGGKQYANQKLENPIYHEFMWSEDKVIHHKVIRATKINKHGMDWEEIYHARFYRHGSYLLVEGEGTPEFWLDDDRNDLFENGVHNWLDCNGIVYDETLLDPEFEGARDFLERITCYKTNILMFDRVIDYFYYTDGSTLDFVFKDTMCQRVVLRLWLAGEFMKHFEEFRKYHGLKDRKFGCEIEFTGISRDTAARVVARIIGNEKEYKGGVYNEHHIVDSNGRTWKIVRGASIRTEVTANRRNPNYGHYSCELVTPILEYKDLSLLSKIVNALEANGAVVNTSCGMHVHVDVSNITAIQLRNIVNLTACREDMLCKALDVRENRLDRWCRKTELDFADEVNGMARQNLSLTAIKSAWYRTLGYSHGHYNSTRYHILNLHSFFEGKGIEFRLFKSTLRANEVKANVILALAICCTGCYQTKTRKFNSYYNGYGSRGNGACKKDMTSFMNQLGIVGCEFRGVREYLVKNMNEERTVA